MANGVYKITEDFEKQLSDYTGCTICNYGRQYV